MCHLASPCPSAHLSANPTLPAGPQQTGTYSQRPPATQYTPQQTGTSHRPLAKRYPTCPQEIATPTFRLLGTQVFLSKASLLVHLILTGEDTFSSNNRTPPPYPEYQVSPSVLQLPNHAPLSLSSPF